MDNQSEYNHMMKYCSKIKQKTATDTYITTGVSNTLCWTCTQNHLHEAQSLTGIEVVTLVGGSVTGDRVGPPMLEMLHMLVS